MDSVVFGSLEEIISDRVSKGIEEIRKKKVTSTEIYSWLQDARSELSKPIIVEEWLRWLTNHVTLPPASKQIARKNKEMYLGMRIPDEYCTEDETDYHRLLLETWRINIQEMDLKYANEETQSPTQTPSERGDELDTDLDFDEYE